MAFKRSAVRSRLAPPLFKRPPFGAAFWFWGVFKAYSIRIRSVFLSYVQLYEAAPFPQGERSTCRGGCVSKFYPDACNALQPPNPRIASSLLKASSSTASPAFAIKAALRSIQSTLRVWSVRITPSTAPPAGSTTSNGRPRTRLVIGLTKARPVRALKASGDRTSAGRRPACSWPA